MTPGFGQKQGSALVESCIVMMLLCLVLFGILQVSYLVAARNVINYTAIATARAAAVGLNDFMLYKVSHYASIPTAGPNRIPGGFGSERPAGTTAGSMWENAIAREHAPKSSLGAYELAVKEAYHMAGTTAFKSILDYDNWQREETGIRFEYARDKDDVITLQVEQSVPLVLPFSQVFFGHLAPVETVRGRGVGAYPAKRIKAFAAIEDHSELYLKDD
ncbi:MAG: pilus assembly protein [Kiritimatiellales bacterium]|nr:pilus assembly protein [Kiritimatiellales bacterium]MCF7863519.1 pilus assembly protein [Kiritimatiellales bacterium]